MRIVETASGDDALALAAAIGRSLVRALAELAVRRGCYGMWVLTDADNAAALATYRTAGAGEPKPQVMLDWDFAP